MWKINFGNSRERFQKCVTGGPWDSPSIWSQAGSWWRRQWYESTTSMKGASPSLESCISTRRLAVRQSNPFKPIQWQLQRKYEDKDKYEGRGPYRQEGWYVGQSKVKIVQTHWRALNSWNAHYIHNIDWSNSQSFNCEILGDDRQAPAGSRDIPGSQDWTKIPIPGLLKIESRDFSGFGKAQKTMFSKTYIGFQTTLESVGDSQNLSKSI